MQVSVKTRNAAIRKSYRKLQILKWFGIDAGSIIEDDGKWYWKRDPVRLNYTGIKSLYCAPIYDKEIKERLITGLRDYIFAYNYAYEISKSTGLKLPTDELKERVKLILEELDNRDWVNIIEYGMINMII